LFYVVELKMTEQLPLDCQRKINFIGENLYEALDDLQSGRITIDGLHLLQEMKANFIDCLQMIQVSFLHCINVTLLK